MKKIDKKEVLQIAIQKQQELTEKLYPACFRYES